MFPFNRLCTGNLKSPFSNYLVSNFLLPTKYSKMDTLREKISQADDSDNKNALYQSLLAQKQVSAEDYLNYAIFLRETNQLSESLALLEKTQLKFGENPWIEDNRARALAGLQRHGESAQAWESAICLANENERQVFLEEIEKVYQILNKKIEQELNKEKLEDNGNKVIGSLKKYLDRQPSNLFIYLELSIAYRNQKNITNALSYLHLAEGNCRESVWIHDNYVRAYVERQLYKRAIKHAELALGLASNAREKILFLKLLDSTKDLQNDNQDANSELIEKIHASGLFDEHYYTQHNSDLDPLLLDMLVHFVEFGWKEGRNPNRYFSSTWYATQFGLDENINPVIHYIDGGCWQLLDTSPNFCTQKYVTSYKQEMQHYDDPLAFFINIGQQLGHKAFKVTFSRGISKRAKKNAPSSVAKDLQLYAQFQGKPDFNGNTRNFNPKHLNIHWIIPDFAEGSGGHMTIFRMINYLERFGHQNTIWIEGQYLNKTCEAAYETIVKHYQFISANIRFFSADFYNTEADAVIATRWDTVWGALGSSKIKRAFYFAQDFEPAFYPSGARALIAEETYRQDIDCICASPWLAQIMTNKYQRWASSFLLSYDSKNYYPNNTQKTKTDRVEIAAYYRPHTDRRAVELVLMGLEQLSNQLADFRVHFFGNSEPILFATPFEYIDHGVLSATELGELYRACDVGVSFSSTNYSLIPQEMMACSLPVVELDTDCCRTVFPKNTITLAKLHPVAIAESIFFLATNTTLAKKQAKMAQQWINQSSWETAAKQVESSIVERLEYFDFKAELNLRSTTNKPEVSVVIPSYNGGELFKTVLQQVLAQELPWEFEVIVIDSSSSDGTAEYLQEQSDIIIHTLQKSDFQHGRTRNLGVELAQGDYVAFITQDALPVSEHWLYYLIASLKKFPKAAGVFGKHMPYAEASPFVKRDLNTHFQSFDKNALSISKFLDRDKYEHEDQDWLQFLRFYSDNNSALRKEVWQQIPYPEIEFGEDQVWARAIIDAGYEKVYSPHALVYHSHNYDDKEKFVRTYEEYTFFKQEFELIFDTINAEILNNEINALNHRDIIYAGAHDSIIDDDELQQQLSLNKGYVLGKYAAYIADSYGELDKKKLLLETLLEGQNYCEG